MPAPVWYIVTKVHHFGHNKHILRRTAYSSAYVIWNIFEFREFSGAFWIHINFHMMEFLNGIADSK